VAISAQSPINIRLATLAPDNSPWSKALRSMGAAWENATDKRVKLTVYAGSIPSESSAIARMAVDGLQAATLMAPGLAEIDEAFNVFGIPFFFESDAELAHVQQNLTPAIRERLRAKGYHLINWGNGGWIQLFSKQPIRTLDDVKQAKLYTTEGNPKMVQWFTANGFHAVPLPAGEIPKQLTLPNGAINAAPMPPIYAMALQVFKNAPVHARCPPGAACRRDGDDRRGLEQDLGRRSYETHEGGLGHGTANQPGSSGRRCLFNRHDESSPGLQLVGARRQGLSPSFVASPRIWRRRSAAR
jgi:hypothetical protein